MTQVAQQPYPATVPGQPAVIILSTAQGTPAQVVNVNADNGTYPHYNTKAARILGILQIILGILIIISEVVLTLISQDYIGPFGFLTSISLILAGIFGVLSAKSKSRCKTVFTTQELIPFNYGNNSLQYENKPDGSYPVAHTTGGGAPYDGMPDQLYQVLQHKHNPAESYLVAHTTGGGAPYDSNPCSPTYEVLQYEQNPAESYIVAHMEGGGAPYDSNPGSPASHSGSTPSKYTETL